MKKIKKILIANRGEIAVRVIHAAKELGICTVAVYSQVDRLAMHVMKADEVYPLSNRGIEPYLDMDQVLEIAELSQAEAIHPGYGFLSENHIFAREAARRGFIFIGPSSEAIWKMGDKIRAKELAQSVDVPVIPGFNLESIEDPNLNERAKEVGFPLLIKARAGGGGKGMRIVNDSKDLNAEITIAMSEAKEAFGDGSIFIEKLIQQPRHIEIQVLADQHGNAVYLFERECSIQRRHQKVIEEAPSSILTPELRREMGEAAIRLVKACSYANAGTLEFIMDQDRHFYFLEMNTRLQVEHPVTELISGVDLVKQQIRIAEGNSLLLKQSQLKINGHAIELRVYAEDPLNSFLPDIGTLRKYVPPKGIGVRVDDGYEQGMEIPVEYDPLIAKLIVHGSDRGEAISRMTRAAEEYEIDGVQNTLKFGAWVMEEEDFREGNIDTGYIADKMERFTHSTRDIDESAIAALVGTQYINQKNNSVKSKKKTILQNRWRSRKDFR